MAILQREFSTTTILRGKRAQRGIVKIPRVFQMFIFICQVRDQCSRQHTEHKEPLMFPPMCFAETYIFTIYCVDQVVKSILKERKIDTITQ